MDKPLAIDLCAGLGGWTEGLLATGWHVCGVDIERHVYGDECYPGSLWLQDILTLHGSQFARAALIVASPPCQFFSYTAMPWSRAKALAAEVRSDPARLEKELALFDACFRIQREACEAAGRHIPMVVENVRGAIPWVGRSAWNHGSFHLWGDVPALMPSTRTIKNWGGSWFAIGGPGQKVTGQNPDGRAVKNPQHLNMRNGHSQTRHLTNPKEHARAETDDIKLGGSWFHGYRKGQGPRNHGSNSTARKAASAMIAKIPFTLSSWIGRTYYPSTATPPAPDQAPRARRSPNAAPSECQTPGRQQDRPASC